MDSASAPGGTATMCNCTSRTDDGEDLRAAARGGRDRQHLIGGAVGGVLLPAHRSERPFQHAADPHRVGPEVKIDRALMQRAFGLRRAVALAQIIEPGWAVIALGPQFGIGDVARDRPTIGAVPLAAELAVLPHIVQPPPLSLPDATFHP